MSYCWLTKLFCVSSTNEYTPSIFVLEPLGTIQQLIWHDSDKSVVFSYFFSFGLTAIALSFLISTFFTRAKYGVYVHTSFLSPTTFALGSVKFADYERAHVGLHWSNIWRASSGVNFLVCLLMMLLDTLLYCMIGLYMDKACPKLCVPFYNR